LPFHVYVLKHPKTDAIRYVGQTSDPVARFKQHLEESGRTHKVRWIRAVYRAGLCPAMEVVFWDIDSQERACLMEMELISALRAQGAKLVNGTDGGEPAMPFFGQKKWTKPKKRKHGRGRRARKIAVLRES